MLQQTSKIHEGIKAGGIGLEDIPMTKVVVADNNQKNFKDLLKPL